MCVLTSPYHFIVAPAISHFLQFSYSLTLIWPRSPTQFKHQSLPSLTLSLPPLWSPLASLSPPLASLRRRQLAFPSRHLSSRSFSMLGARDPFLLHRPFSLPPPHALSRWSPAAAASGGDRWVQSLSSCTHVVLSWILILCCWLEPLNRIVVVFEVLFSGNICMCVLFYVSNFWVCFLMC